MFAETLRTLREENGFSQHQVAKILQVHRSTYSYYESGKSQPPFSTLVKLANIFNVDPNFLLGYEYAETTALHDHKSYYISKNKDVPRYVCDLSSDEQKLIMAYRIITDRELLLKTAEDLLEAKVF
ncbi:MAG: helix-turn-helix transcriptional regulator [Oscillospiraceae bacterium]|nr:helix-turn-helix transcriptional regulator [Oscillospiraceae bacterium]